MGPVSLVNAPQDAAVADYLANDLARQGVAVTRGAGGGGPMLLLIGPDSAGDPGLQAVAAQAAQAAQAGRAIYVARLGEVAADWPALRGAVSWTEAYGPYAQANVAALAARLREEWPAASASPWGGAAPDFPPPPGPSGPPPSGGQGASDRGSLIALGVVAALGLVVLILYLTGALGNGRAGSAGGAATAEAGVSDAWLAGTWRESCGDPEFMRLDPASGTATFQNGGARFTRNGDELTVAGNGQAITMTVAYVGQNQMRASVDGREELLVRCD